MTLEQVKELLRNGYARHIDYCLARGENPLPKKLWEEKVERELIALERQYVYYGVEVTVH